MNGMDRQTLRDWVHRYNADGVAGLISRVSAGPAPVLTEAEMAELRALVLNGPGPATDEVVRWRCIDLRDKVAQRYAVYVHKRTVAKWLGKLEMTRLQPRPFHPKKDGAAQETFKNVWPAPSASSFCDMTFASLHLRIRPVGIAPAKMEIRAFWSS